MTYKYKYKYHREYMVNFPKIDGVTSVTFNTKNLKKPLYTRHVYTNSKLLLYLSHFYYVIVRGYAYTNKTFKDIGEYNMWCDSQGHPEWKSLAEKEEGKES